MKTIIYLYMQLFMHIWTTKHKFKNKPYEMFSVPQNLLLYWKEHTELNFCHNKKMFLSINLTFLGSDI